MSRSDASVTKRRSGSTPSTLSFDAGPPDARTLPVVPSANGPSSSARTTPGFQLGQLSTSVHRAQTRSRETGASTECSKSHITSPVSAPESLTHPVSLHGVTAASVALERSRRQRRGQIYVALAAVAWSTAGVLQRQLTLDTATQVFGRAVFAGLALLAYVAVVERGRFVQAFRSVGLAGIAVALCVATASGSFIAA